jgi:hypothetical protein
MPAPVAAVQCRADVASGTLSCGGGPAGAPGPVILGGQGTAILLTASGVVYDPVDSSFTFLTRIQNLSSQPFGFGVNGPAGVRFFFQQLPTALTGTGAITLIGDSIGTFTAAGQHYYVDPGAALYLKQTSAGTTMKFHVPPTVLTFSFALLVSAELVESSGPTHWSSVTGRSANGFRGVAAAGPTDAVAVGLFGGSRRWNGSTWRDLSLFADVDLNAVTSLGGGEYLAVGDGGEIWRLKGNVWTLVYTESQGHDLTSVWAKDGDHFVAAGDAGATVTRNGAAFTEQVLSSGGDSAVAVTGKSDGSVVAVLLASNTLLTSTGGAPFIEVNTIAGEGGGISYDENDDLLWSYYIPATTEGVILLEGSELYRLAGIRPLEVTSLGGKTVAIAFYQAPFDLSSVWFIDYHTLPVGLNSGGLISGEIRSFALAGINLFETDAAQGLFESLAFLVDQQPLVGTTPELWGIGDTAWIATGDPSGKVGRIVDGVLTEQLTNWSRPSHIGGISSTEVYISSDAGLFRSDGNDWNFETFTQNGVISAIWGDTATGNMIITSDAGDVKTRVGGNWDTFFGAIPAGADAKIWGCSVTNAWIAVSGQFFRWNGTAATQDLSFDAINGGAPIFGLSGTSCNDLWAVGGFGAAHFDGTGWTSVGFGGWGAVAARSPGLAWMFDLSGSYGRIQKTDGSGWYVGIPTQERAITAVWRLASGDLLVAGNGFLLWGSQ